MRLNGIEMGPGGLIRFELTGVTDEEAKPLGELWGEEVVVCRRDVIEQQEAVAAEYDASRRELWRQAEEARAALEVLRREAETREGEIRAEERERCAVEIEQLARPETTRVAGLLRESARLLRKGSTS